LNFVHVLHFVLEIVIGTKLRRNYYNTLKIIVNL